MEINIGEINFDNEIKIGNIEFDAQKVYPDLEDLEVTPSSVVQEFNHPNSYGYDNVTVKAVASDNLNITPTTESQEYVGLYGTVNVSAVDSSIDSDIQASNIKQGVEILGVTGNVIELQGETRETTPTESTQVITPTAGKNGITQITVNPIPSEYIVPTGTKSITENGLVNVKNYENANVNVPSFWTEPQIKDVNFIDYDGTLLYSYTLAEIQAMTELPELPIHTGLTCQGWNWTLQELKDLGRDMEVGAMYITTNGKTKAYIELFYPNTEGTLCFTQTVANSVKVNWGDGSADETDETVGNVTLTHTYANTGKYTITLDSTEPYDIGHSVNQSNYNCFFGSTAMNNSAWKYSLRSVEVGRNVRKLAYASFREIPTLQTITLPQGLDLSAGNVFYGSECLRGCVLPRAETTIGGYMLSNCTAMKFVSVPPNMTEFISSFLAGAHALKRFNMPNITNINVLSNLGRNIEKLYIPDLTGNFSNGSGKGLANNYGLKQIRMPQPIEGVSNSQWKTLTASCFANDRCLEYIEVPPKVNNIGTSIFDGCYSLKVADFSKCEAVPTLQGATNMFRNCPDTEIWIPEDLYEDWTGATNWNSLTNTFVGK